MKLTDFCNFKVSPEIKIHPNDHTTTPKPRQAYASSIQESPDCNPQKQRIPSKLR